MRDVEQRTAAKAFAEYWKGKGDEKGESQKFWLSLLQGVLGVEHPEQFISFEDRVFLGHTSFIDGYIPETKVLIEQKKLGKNLKEPIKQSDGTLLSPFQQAKRYAAELPYSQRPRWIVTCNFETFHVYDMEQPGGEPEVIELANLEKEYYRLNFLVDSGNENLKREMEISIAAGDLVGVLYDALLKQYKDPTNVESLKSLNMLCVRLVFCLYAEDAGIFGKRTMFHDYMAQFDAKLWRQQLIQLFRILDQTEEERDPYMNEDLAAFPYVNGGLFSDENIEIPNFTDEIRNIVLAKASEDFDWSEISPTIFGAVFESTLNPETRRSGGMHYTSIENIHKVIDPLFLDDLKSELEDIRQIGVEKTRKAKLAAYQDKLASLKFLDPACGSGNFLTETYICLRRMENEVIMALTGGQMTLGDIVDPVKVSIRQFYGIEINDFAVTVARTALWIAESQMLKETENIVHMKLDFLPLKTNAYIIEGNALRMDWRYLHEVEATPLIRAKKTNLITYEDIDPGRPYIVAEPGVEYGEVDLITDELHIGKARPEVPEIHYDYIMGNPPFVGHQWRSKRQQEDMDIAFADFETYGKLDYVAAWYKGAAEYTQGEGTACAFVSTNSIVQGESVATIWRPLFEKWNLTITFAWLTFVWNSESNEKAHVHCVIIGFTCGEVSRRKLIYKNATVWHEAENINGYLLDAPNIFIENRGKPLTEGMPNMSKGSQPTDGGNLLLSPDEREEMLRKYPASEPLIKKYISADDYINNKTRYCMWLKGISPSAYAHIPPVVERLEKVKEMRLKSPTKSVQRDADIPMLFTQIRQPETNYLVVPEVSSSQRRYIPIGFMTPEVIASNKLYLISDASLYMFGVIISNVHMSWMRVTTGRLKSDYSYSPAVYNNFPWPAPTDEQRKKIEQTAQGILDARSLYPDASLADLYKDVTMPPELRKAHQENDRAVMRAYGFSIKDMTESSCVAALMKLYQEKVTEKN